MARRKGIFHAISQAQIDAERRRNAQQKAQAQLLRAQAAAQREATRQWNAQVRLQAQEARTHEQEQRAYERAQRVEAQEQTRAEIEARIAEANARTEEIARCLHRLQSILSDTLKYEYDIDLEHLKEEATLPVFEPGFLGVAEPYPDWKRYAPPEPSGIQKMMPRAQERYMQAVAVARHRYDYDLWAYQQREYTRQSQMGSMWYTHQENVRRAYDKVAAQHAEIDLWRSQIEDRQREAVIRYFMSVLEISEIAPSEAYPLSADIGYLPHERQLVIEFDLPDEDIIPHETSFRYVKSRGEIIASFRSEAEVKSLYTSLIGQLALSLLFVLFDADRFNLLNVIVINGYVDRIDTSTGLPVRPCLLTIQVRREEWARIDLAKVDPIACLRRLNMALSSDPLSAVPVRPVLDLSALNSRLTTLLDTSAETNSQVNLMDLDPLEFERLIASLFERMGLQTQLTKASHDGGIDCIAVDPRPIVGGEIIIQAKRYRHSVGVSVVRDLFGAMQDRRTAKGVLVTTSGYGNDSYNFAADKPIQLIDGPLLVDLLAQHMEMDAIVVMNE